MKTFLISNKLKLAVSLFLSVFIFVIGLVVAGPDFAKANDEQL